MNRTAGNRRKPYEIQNFVDSNHIDTNGVCRNAEMPPTIATRVEAGHLGNTAPTVDPGFACCAKGTPSIKASPDDGRTSPRIMRKVVLLPAPLGPSKPVTEP